MKSCSLSTTTVPRPVVGDENPSGAPVLALRQEGLPEQHRVGERRGVLMELCPHADPFPLSPHRTGREPYQFIRLSSDPWPCSGCIPPSPACHEWHGDGSASTPPGSSVGARPSGGPRLVARLSPVGAGPATS